MYNKSNGRYYDNHTKNWLTKQSIYKTSMTIKHFYSEVFKRKKKKKDNINKFDSKLAQHIEH